MHSLIVPSFFFMKITRAPYRDLLGCMCFFFNMSCKDYAPLLSIFLFMYFLAPVSLEPGSPIFSISPLIAIFSSYLISDR